MRSRAWRRWRWEVISERVRKHRSMTWHTYDPDNSFGFQKKTSVTETVEVPILCESHHNDYVRLLIRRRRDTRTPCSCWVCASPSKMGWGNSNKTLSFKQAKALSESVKDIEQSGADLPNSLWKRRTFRCKN